MHLRRTSDHAVGFEWRGQRAAVVQESYEVVAGLATRALQRFQRGEGLVSSLPRGSGDLLTTHEGSFSARIPEAEVRVCLWRLLELEENNSDRVDEPLLLTVEAPNRHLDLPVLVPGPRDAWQLAQAIQARKGPTTFVPFVAEDRRGEAVFPEYPRLKHISQVLSQVFGESSHHRFEDLVAAAS